MTARFDPMRPGPAGLFFRTDRLSSIGWQQEHTARQSLEHCCTYCGQSACYGYGVPLASEGTWTCADPDCRAQGEAWMASRGKAEALLVEARKSAPEPVAEPILNLFGEAA